ncbi:hypothetical protein GCM10010156_20610 [Planobispora rosea]|uniref:Secreted protein n=1 Tax=Planobispora rosea TaxID=35762 RepID=A0A8J3S4B2_PLARO|nr:hypothetical protein [Planobispora rosea]GGS61777.1 hypothetical protein GCM10010156_20610 [Planobispora rosea]GIH86564.1 hypothetical protein Pro02_49720 [Planobispora rosea]
MPDKIVGRVGAVGLLALALFAPAAATAFTPAAAASPQPGEQVTSGEPEAAGATASPGATDQTSGTRVGPGSRLVVADPAASQVHVYAIPSHRRTATITGRTPSGHAGMLPLRDGRVLFVDETNHELVALQVTGVPRIVGAVPLPEGEVTHIAVDPANRYAVVAAAEEHDHEEESQEIGQAEEEEEGHGILTLVDLGTYTPSSVEVHSAHPGVMIGGEPLTIVHRNDADNTLETFPVSAILASAGGHLEPTSSVPTGAAGHGEALAGDLALTATDAGLDTARLRAGSLTPVRTVPWPAETGRAFYVRLSADGRNLVTYTSNESGDDWQNWLHDAFLVDPATGRSVTTRLGTGFLFRFGLSDRYAGYVLQQPGGDKVSFVDVRPGSSRYGKITANVQLGSLPGGPAVGSPPWGTQGRRIALDPTGALAYVSGGGTGRISVISPDHGRTVGTITTPTRLDGGGALTVVTPGRSDADTVGR